MFLDITVRKRFVTMKVGENTHVKPIIVTNHNNMRKMVLFPQILWFKLNHIIWVYFVQSKAKCLWLCVNKKAEIMRNHCRPDFQNVPSWNSMMCKRKLWGMRGYSVDGVWPGNSNNCILPMEREKNMNAFSLPSRCSQLNWAYRLVWIIINIVLWVALTSN